MVLGEVIGTGVRSSVYALSATQVLKVPLPSTPDAWIRSEAAFTTTVQGAGFRVPKVHDVVEFEGRPAIVYERIEGPSMWALIRDDPARAAEMGAVLAGLHADVLVVVGPMPLPRQRDRLASKLRSAARRGALQVDGLTSLLPSSGRESALCHGDLHPGNVVMSPDGPVLLDWFDACRGEPLGDIARTTILLGDGEILVPSLPHLPGARAEVVTSVREAYIAEIERLRGPFDSESLSLWRGIEAAARLAEIIESG